MAELKGGQIVGNYRVVGLIGRGGMGRVYEVEHLALRTHYALKILDATRVTPEASSPTSTTTGHPHCCPSSPPIRNGVPLASHRSPNI